MTMQDDNSILAAPKHMPWNKGKLTGAKPPLLARHVWSIRTKLQIEKRNGRCAHDLSPIKNQWPLPAKLLLNKQTGGRLLIFGANPHRGQASVDSNSRCSRTACNHVDSDALTSTKAQYFQAG
jgi:hypothetical protein